MGLAHDRRPPSLDGEGGRHQVRPITMRRFYGGNDDEMPCGKVEPCRLPFALPMQ